MGRVFASADWHGACSHLTNKVFNYLQPEDTLYFVGDSIDRGNAGIELFDKLINDSRVIYIKGNHEDMMAAAISQMINGNGNRFIQDWLCNGGNRTWESLKGKSDDELVKYVQIINHMPTKFIYKSPKEHTVILEHAGFSPFIKFFRTHDPLWDRYHFGDPWDEGCDYKELDAETTYLVHGHTPVEYLKYDYGYYGQEEIKDKQFFIEKNAWRINDISRCPKPEVIRYCDAHKFDIDMCTAASDRIALLDLDTFETIYFDKEDK